MPSLAPERCKGLVRRELGFVSFLLLWLLYWNLFNKGYIKKKKKNSNQTPGRSGSRWFLHFPSARDYLIFFTSSTGAFLEVPLRSEPLIGSRFFVLLDILANLTFTQKKKKGGTTNERRVRKARGRESQEGLAPTCLPRSFDLLASRQKSLSTAVRLICRRQRAASCEASKRERKEDKWLQTAALLI